MRKTLQQSKLQLVAIKLQSCCSAFRKCRFFGIFKLRASCN
nr:MAG TPA: hypothetical protein [Caudoviricetes sp.]